MNQHQHRHPNGDQPKSFWKTPLGWAFVGFAAIAAFFLVAEHTAHVIGWLPWLLLLACPLMHIFMHGGHGHGGHRHDHGESKNTGPRDAPPAQREK